MSDPSPYGEHHQDQDPDLIALHPDTATWTSSTDTAPAPVIKDFAYADQPSSEPLSTTPVPGVSLPAEWQQSLNLKDWKITRALACGRNRGSDHWLLARAFAKSSNTSLGLDGLSFWVTRPVPRSKDLRDEDMLRQAAREGLEWAEAGRMYMTVGLSHKHHDRHTLVDNYIKNYPDHLTCTTQHCANHRDSAESSNIQMIIAPMNSGLHKSRWHSLPKVYPLLRYEGSRKYKLNGSLTSDLCT